MRSPIKSDALLESPVTGMTGGGQLPFEHPYVIGYDTKISCE